MLRIERLLWIEILLRIGQIGPLLRIGRLQQAALPLLWFMVLVFDMFCGLLLQIELILWIGILLWIG